MTWILMTMWGCVPELESPQQDTSTQDSCDWDAPSNSWPMNEPSCLTGEGFDEGSVVPDMRLLDQNGEEVSMWQFYGMLVVLDFSTMWCAPCAELADGVDETTAEFADEGFAYITVLSQDTNSNVPDTADLNEWGEQHSVSQPILSDDGTYAEDAVPTSVFPRLVLIDRDMRVLIEKITPSEDAAVRAAVESAL